MNERKNNIYKKMYFKLLNANKEIIDLIKKAKQEAEKIIHRISRIVSLSFFHFSRHKNAP